ncbi:MAG TPA: hypothetical protein VIH08_00770 [Blastococcus sp.]|jgi:hypothetical protein
MPSHTPSAVPADAPTVVESGDRWYPGANSTDRDDPHAWANRRRGCEALVAAYGGDTYRLLTDLAGPLEASLAYVDRLTVEAHLQRPLSDSEWSAIACRFTAIAFDAHVGDAGTIRTDWIEDVLLRADVPGRRRTVSHPSSPPRHPIRR